MGKRFKQELLLVAFILQCIFINLFFFIGESSASSISSGSNTPATPATPGPIFIPSRPAPPPPPMPSVSPTLPANYQPSYEVNDFIRAYQVMLD